MTTDTSLQCAQAALGFAALTMGHLHDELEQSNESFEPERWQKASQAVSQWLRTHYSDALIEQAKALLAEHVAEPDSTDGDQAEVALAARQASDATLELLLAHAVSATSAAVVRAAVSAAVEKAWQQAYGSDDTTD